MIIKKFRIQNYRAIRDTFIDLNYRLNPIIGVNESGKTTILQAILCFDKQRDRYNLGKHLKFQNKYSTNRQDESRITATILLSKDEFADFIESNSINQYYKDFHLLKALENNPEFELTRVLKEGTHNEYILNGDFHPSMAKTLKKYILEHLPSIIYFDDFTDRVPDEIIFSDDYVKDGSLSSKRIRDWQEIIVEVFKRAKIERNSKDNDPLTDFLTMSDDDKKDGILSDIQDMLNEEIIEEWKRIKKSGKAQFADDSEKLELVLKNDKNTFIFKVKDKSFEDKKRTFNIDDRSKGFQWFFNYMIKLKFNTRYKNKIENSIFLLDEPGSYLHSSAQSELLKELGRVAAQNYIIYCTHSQYLLNPADISLGSIRISAKVDSQVSVTSFGNYKEKRNQGALSPLYQSLGLNFSQDFIGKVVITEGIIDFYFFRMLQEFSGLINTNIRFIPGSGSGNLTSLISLGLGFAENFLVLFDNDRGLSAIKKYVEEFGDEIKNHFVLYSDSENFRLEDFLSSNAASRLKEMTGANSVKKAIPLLFYADGMTKKSFFTSLDQETLGNLSHVKTRLDLL